MTTDSGLPPQRLPPIPVATATVSHDWRLWADATCAGLSVLIPVPLVDLVFEGIFRRRIPGAVARARGRALSEAARRRLGKSDWDLVGGCLALPFKIVKYILRRIWRKLIYIFTIADAVDALSEYWHRAFLIDHLVRAGHVDHDTDLELTGRLFDEVLEAADTSGVKALARQMVTAVGHAPRLLRRARREGAEGATRELAGVLDTHWQVFERSLLEVAEGYDERRRQLLDAGEDPART